MKTQINKLEYFEDSTIYCELLRSESWMVYLDSCYSTSKFGRYDIIAADPFIKLISYGNKIQLEEFNETIIFYDNPFFVINDILKKYKCDESIEPFTNGLIGYFGYEADIQSILKISANKSTVPDVAIGIYDWSIIVDHKDKKSWISSYGNDSQTLKRIKHYINNYKDYAIDKNTQFSFSNFKCNTNEHTYNKNINKIKNYIKEGDCYQVNYSQSFESDYVGDEWLIYKEIRKINPAPYSAFFKRDNQYVISSSPERFIKVCNGIVETKPIKGTIKRMHDANKDKKQIEFLKNDKKNISENLMIVDLLRNDLSKSCKLGTVKVDKLFNIESYKSVHHMVSTISGEISDNLTSLDLFKGCFPGGSITGAPKKRSMEIIRELEGVDRKLYCGSIGYLGFDGNMDTNICIRTITLNNNKLYFSAGGGIVNDSNTHDEYNECFAKVEQFLNFFSNGNFKW
ncbi:MAG: aminodeoxychorismate synthase component I [Pseudomonadota bacterium]|nr:aminodeoxychorismate synthase component I [Pseudomonadota bacterium]